VIIMKNSEKAKQILKRYMAPIALTAGSLAAWGIGASVEPELVNEFGENGYLWRFATYVPFAVAGAETFKNVFEDKAGRPLTKGEKLAAYAAGAAVAASIYKGWEVFGSSGATQEILKQTADRVGTETFGKTDFYAKGRWMDVAYSTLGALGVEGVKEYASKLRNKNHDKDGVKNDRNI
jgi:hypothetical protein